MNIQNTLLGLLPPVSYARNAEYVVRQARTDGRVLQNVADTSGTVSGAVTPEQSNELLSSWERVLGLDNSNKPYQYRVAAVVAKINDTGGLSIPYFLNLAEQAGYEIYIDEEDVFRAGTSCAGDELNIEEAEYRWCVQVVNGDVSTYLFRAGEARSGDLVSWQADPIIESIFNDLKPAWTYCRFEYREEIHA
ncbi:YmfQ family protein [Neisseria sp. DTU_2021_1001991_1_SI_NGA_ILE_055]|uniref:YmfQ family protein n=1 Tax=Neisseria sp. DTU_2021_1001991_1_SI_NGA_ILE_055 TaxID=3077590 RepID=UPI0028E84A2D|nr:putative phage tail protein [Neisseria sp. DTU_2021_1001991_1_SI_NGA_ILE_055]WNS83225.1 putative phage tail protein [Neisseria sp. DTU_2021_1001991_1_SI_NGA_ILE_055]